jgi:small subunit ribosomal protein S20
LNNFLLLFYEFNFLTNFVASIVKRYRFNYLYIMANHKSSIKRARQTEGKTVHNKYYAKTTRNAVKTLRHTTEKTAAQELYPKIVSMLDKLAKMNIVHKNKASNLKSSLAKHVNGL